MLIAVLTDFAAEYRGIFQLLQAMSGIVTVLHVLPTVCLSTTGLACDEVLLFLEILLNQLKNAVNIARRQSFYLTDWSIL